MHILIEQPLITAMETNKTEVAEQYFALREQYIALAAQCAIVAAQCIVVAVQCT